MKIFFIGFWEGFYETDQSRYCLLSDFVTNYTKDFNDDMNYSMVDWKISPLTYFLLLLEKTFNEKMELGTQDDSDILFESVFCKTTLLHYKQWKYTFLFTGESDRRILHSILQSFDRINDFDKYSCILGNRIGGNNIILPFFSIYSHCFNFNKKFISNEKITTVPKKSVCVIVSNLHDSEGRNYFFEKLESKIHIDYAGRYKNNTIRIRDKHCSKKFVEFVSQYKFIVSMENSKNETYITEKILHGFCANTIPVYWGSDNVTNYFNKERFINVSNFNEETIDSVIEKILELNNNDEKYLEMINKPIYVNNEVHFNMESVSQQIKQLLF